MNASPAGISLTSNLAGAQSPDASDGSEEGSSGFMELLASTAQPQSEDGSQSSAPVVVTTEADSPADADSASDVSASSTALALMASLLLGQAPEKAPPATVQTGNSEQRIDVPDAAASATGTSAESIMQLAVSADAAAASAGAASAFATSAVATAAVATNSVAPSAASAPAPATPSSKPATPIAGQTASGGRESVLDFGSLLLNETADLSKVITTAPQVEDAPVAGRSLPDLTTSLSSMAAVTMHREAGTAPLQNAADAAAQSPVRQDVGTPGWAEEVGSRVVLMSLQGQHEGSLQLTPEHLGPLEVHISVGHDKTDVWFGATQAETRTALHEAMPRLRELFAASGLSLGQAGVSQQMPRQEARNAAASNAARTSFGVDSTNDVAAPQAQRITSALLDTWA